MWDILGSHARLCDGLTRREVLRFGGVSAFGLGLPHLLRSRSAAAEMQSAGTRSPLPGARAKNCIVLFLMGGPSQHSTWDPKPDAPAEVRGEFAPIATSVPGLQFSELMPETARLAHHICVLRAVSSGDNAHSSSGYYMLTGRPHTPMNFENANPGPPNDFPSMGAVVRKLNPSRGVIPSAVTLPHHIFNTDRSVWPGQDAGFLGQAVDPWIVNCAPAEKSFRVQGLTLPRDVPPLRLERRQSLLAQFNQHRSALTAGGLLDAFDADTRQAFDLLASGRSAQAFRLDDEPAAVRERYGRSPFGQSVLLSRRLIEAGVKLVQVNWYRAADEPPSNPCWDSHTNEAQRLRKVLAPPTDRAYSALLEDLSQRGLLDGTLVVCMAEFGRSPRINGQAGRDHWGSVYSVALAGGGVRGGQAFGASDAIGGQPKEGRVRPHDLAATVFDRLGYRPETTINDPLGRPLPISTGEPIGAIV
ncbi:MAG TPA: DUF1501 domain-containing protein [Planctomycetaceae bacterium]|jgi:hypothetical protein|nr:DUF1501 domain-containing protein [Planctomycetaceae bacterium]